MGQLTELLGAARRGDDGAGAQVFGVLYPDLKRMARGRLRSVGAAAELNTTALVHESYLRFVKRRQLSVEDRAAFFGYVGKVMRSVLVDSVRERHAAKRGGADAPVTLTTDLAAGRLDDDRLLELDQAMGHLSRIAPRLHQLVELRYFAGSTLREISGYLGVSERSLERDWQKARGFLRKLMDEGPSPAP